ncbi:solute carrier family 22 member 21-like isoform X1 [Styela clava]
MLSIDIESIFENCDGFNLHHKFGILSIFLIAIQVGAINFTSVFIFDIPDHRCYIPAVDEIERNISRSILLRYIPHEGPNGNEFSKCKRYVNVSNHNITLNTTGSYANEYCKDGWVYNAKDGVKTGTEEFDLVCNDDWQRILLTLGFSAGPMFSGLIAGMIVDRFGRKKPTIIYGMIISSLMIAYSFAPNFASCVIWFTLLGAINAAAFCTAFLYVQELVKTDKRATISCLIYSFESFSYMLVPAIAYLCQDWRWILRVVGLIGILYIPSCWIIFESPRWLASKGRIAEATKVMKFIMRKNTTNQKLLRQNIFLISSPAKSSTTKSKDSKETHFIILLRNRVLLKRCFIISWIITATLTSYYGFGFNTSNLEGNKYWNCFISAAAELPGWIFAPYFLQKFGRRSTLSAAYAISCLCSILCPVFGNYNAVSIAFAMLGKVFISSTMAMIFLYPAELFPTKLRNTALGFSATLSRFGGLMAPFIAFTGESSKLVPFLILSGIALVASIVTLLLPETKDLPLPETLEESLALEKYRLQVPSCKKAKLEKNTRKTATSTFTSDADENDKIKNCIL